jgi:prepilin-type N-terminal cleavage/methylation domain-containing protein
MKSAKPRSVRESGFTLVEVSIAMMLLTMAAMGVAQLFGLAIRQNQASRYQTSATVLASQKLEQLRSLTFGYDESTGAPTSDTTTNLGAEPTTSGGAGLNPSPSNSLATTQAGYGDYLDARGNWVGTGGSPPAAALYIRRWNVSPLPADPNNALILQVLVTTVHRERQASQAGQRRRLTDEALVATVKTRKAR